jgi:hypothetical protein
MAVQFSAAAERILMRPMCFLALRASDVALREYAWGVAVRFGIA